MSGELEIKWQEASLDEVAAFWAKQYRAPIKHYEWFLDASKGKMIFKLFVGESEEEIIEIDRQGNVVTRAHFDRGDGKAACGRPGALGYQLTDRTCPECLDIIEHEYHRALGERGHG